MFTRPVFSGTEYATLRSESASPRRCESPPPARYLSPLYIVPDNEVLSEVEYFDIVYWGVENSEMENNG